MRSWKDDFPKENRYFETEDGILYCGDCLDILKSFPDSKINFVFSDIPYNAKKDYGIYKDNLDLKDYKKWMSKVVFEAKRISQGLCLLVGNKILKLIWDIIPDSKMIVIHRRAIGGHNKNYFYMYFGLLTTKEPVEKTFDLWNDVRMSSEGYFCKEERYPHPAPTSVSVTEKVIRTFTENNDIVLDCFSGTGTTGVVCKRYSRKFILVEIKSDYCEIAKQRILKTEKYNNIEDYF